MPVSANSFLILAVSVSSTGVGEQVAEHAVPEGMEVTLTARLSNTQNIYVANSAANAIGTNRKVLVSGQSTVFRIDNTDKIYIDADNTNDVLELTIQKIPSTT